MKEIPLHRKGLQGFTALVDDADYEWLSARRWYLGSGGYAWTGGWCAVKKRPKAVFMHKLLAEAPSGHVVDHIDGDPMNNQRSNLRVASRSENALNNPSRRTIRGRWASLRDVSRSLGISDWESLLLIRSGVIEAYNPGARFLVSWSSIDAYNRTRRPPGNPEWQKTT